MVRKKVIWSIPDFSILPTQTSFVKDEVMSFLEVRESGKAKRPKLRYSKGTFTIVKPKDLELDKSSVVEDNLEWFESYLEEARSYREQVPERRFEEGETFSVMGDEKQIIIEKRRSNKVDDDIFLARHLAERTSLKDQLEKALRGFARETLERKASEYVCRVEGDFNRIFIRDQKTRWGSCSSKNNLNFNWRLVLGPEHVLDYVVVHELVHLEIKNHGREFERRVKEIFPEASVSEEWLRDSSAKLVFDPEF